jgi:hypothetical protein
MKTKTNRQEIIADIFAIVDGHNGIDSDYIMARMESKGYDGSIVNDCINTLENTGALEWVSGLWYLNDEGNEGQTINKTKKEKTMKTETTEKPAYENDERKIIEDIFQDKKELSALQLGRALSDYFVDPEERKNIREEFIKAGIIEKTYNRKYRLVSESIETVDIEKAKTPAETKKAFNKGKKPTKKQEKPIVVTAGVDTDEVKKTAYDKKQRDILISMNAVKDGIEVAIKALDNNTLKQVKTDVYNLLNTEARKHLSNEFVSIITEANNTRVKKDYASELRIALKELNTLIEQEQDIQEKDKVEISIPEKVKALTPDTAMLINQLDMKEKSRFDCLFEIMQKQEKKIDELSRLVSCHKDTINLLINRLNNGQGKVSTKEQTTVKTVEKSVKTDEEIQIEKRQAFIIELKGIDKAVFDILTTQKRLRDTDFLIMEALEDYTPKMIKASIAKMAKVGLFESKKQKNTLSYIYTIAPVSAFKGEGKKTVKKDTEKPVKDTKETKTKKGFTRGKKKGTVKAFIGELVSEGKYTRKQIIDKAIAHGFKESTAKVTIVGGKSEKYHYFDKLIKEDKKTKILSF